MGWPVSRSLASPSHDARTGRQGGSRHQSRGTLGRSVHCGPGLSHHLPGVFMSPERTDVDSRLGLATVAARWRGGGWGVWQGAS